MKNVRSNCQQASVTAWFDLTKDGRLCLRFLKATMDRPYMEKHFGTHQFNMMVGIDLPDAIAFRLGLSTGQRRIAPGKYAVKETPDQLIVEF